MTAPEHMFSGLDVAGKTVALRDIPVDKYGRPVVHTRVDRPCPQCGGPMVVRQGPTERFLGCPDYPTCQGKMWLERDNNLACRWRLTTPRDPADDPLDHPYDDCYGWDIYDMFTQGE